MMTQEIEVIFENIVTQINTQFSTNLKKGVKTYYNFSLEEVLSKGSLDNCVSLVYMGTSFAVRTNEARKRLHEYVVIISHKDSLEMAFWWNDYKKDAYIYPLVEPTKSYVISILDIIPSSETEERFLKTSIIVGIYE